LTIHLRLSPDDSDILNSSEKLYMPSFGTIPGQDRSHRWRRLRSGAAPRRVKPEAMNLHLAEIAAQIAPGAHAALLVDQAGWHLSSRLVMPPNITLIPLPAKCPELNPQENVWQFLRDNWLSNRIFKSYDDVVDHCCEAWNNLVDQPWRIMSIGLRNWAHGS
jgi:transposase